MRIGLTAILAVIQLVIASVAIDTSAPAQSTPRRVVAKNGESIELGPLYYISNCRSIMVGRPDVEVLESPPGVTLSVKEEPVLPRRQGCAAKVAGGTLMLTAEGITEPIEARLTYRIKYKTKDGDRQTSNAYIVSLFP